MNELKTLKDMGKIIPKNTFKIIKSEFPYAVTSYELRQNAINDIKAIRENQDNPPFLVDKPEQLVGYIMWKNNLTEEDLK